MKIFEKSIEELIPYVNNPRNNEEAIEFVAASIKEFGFKNPIIIDKNGVIIAGHTRHAAAKRLGLQKVPCIIADDLSEQQIKAFRLADNKTAEFATWDLEKLEIELEGIDDLEMADFGFEELEEEEDDIEPIEDDFDENPEHMTERGQLWELGRHRLKIGDSTIEEDVADLIGGGTIDLMLTDPPYNVNVGKCGRPSPSKNNIGIENDNMSEKDFIEFLTKAMRNAANNMKAGAAYYIFYAGLHHIEFQRTIENIKEFKLHEQLIWVKDAIVLGRNSDYQWMHEPCLYGWKEGAAHYFTDSRSEATVIEDKGVKLSTLKKSELIELCEKMMGLDKPSTIIRSGKSIGEFNHPTIKPQALLCYLMKNSSRKGENVLDLFGGSGSTMIAAEQLGRNCFLMEIDEHFADIIINRYIQFKGTAEDVFLIKNGAKIPFEKVHKLSI